MIIVFDGPEKAGKSTIISKVAQLYPKANIRPWGPVSSEMDYMDPAVLDASVNRWCIWDRGWASEHVYAKLLDRDRTLGRDPWLGEWMFGRLASVKIMLIPSDYEDSAKRRDKTDLPVDPYQECKAFEYYGRRFGYHVLYNDYTERSDQENVAEIQRLMHDAELAGALRYPYWLGPRDAKVVFITGTPKNIIPFRGPLTQQFGREFGDIALKCAWASTGHPKELLEYRTVVLIGDLKTDLHLTNNANVLYLNVLNDYKEVTNLLDKIKELI